MKQNNQLQEGCNSLKSCAAELESVITKLEMCYKEEDESNNILPSKIELIKPIANSIEKMRRIASLISESNESKTVSVSKTDASVLSFFKENYEDYRKQSDQLAVVLSELVKKLDLDGTGIEVFILLHVADAIDGYHALLETIKDIEY